MNKYKIHEWGCTCDFSWRLITLRKVQYIIEIFICLLLLSLRYYTHLCIYKYYIYFLHSLIADKDRGHGPFEHATNHRGFFPGILLLALFNNITNVSESNHWHLNLHIDIYNIYRYFNKFLSAHHSARETTFNDLRATFKIYIIYRQGKSVRKLNSSWERGWGVGVGGGVGGK